MGFVNMGGKEFIRHRCAMKRLPEFDRLAICRGNYFSILIWPQGQYGNY